MSYLDSPISPCEKIKEYVLTDCSQAECANEHNCDKNWICPLGKYFEKQKNCEYDKQKQLT